MSTMTRLILGVLTVVAFGTTHATAQSSQDSVLSALKTIDPEILQYFPRWKICEPDLQFQIKQTFTLMGYRADNLDIKNIVVTAAPRKVDETDVEYDLILVECGRERMVASEIQSNMRKLSYRIADSKRPYCYVEIPPSQPPSSPQIDAIIDFGQPTNVRHAFTLSAFEQTLKVGNSGFWIKSSLGTDRVGYHYWESGEGKIELQRPLYENLDPEYRRAIPYLINAHLGAGYRITGGLEGQNRLLDFIAPRKLNSGYGGKFVGGLDFYMPFHAPFGLAINMELPLQGINNSVSIDPTTYYQLPPAENRILLAENYTIQPISTVAILRTTGQVTAFYNWWIDPKNPENFIRVDAGISYAEVKEAALFQDTAGGIDNAFLALDVVTQDLITTKVSGLRTWRPTTPLDWVYLKAEYRNQNSFPFGFSLQYSNQMLLGRIYVPLLGDWLYLEGRYSTPVRGTRPFEIRNFFMISPVLRFNF